MQQHSPVFVQCSLLGAKSIQHRQATAAYSDASAFLAVDNSDKLFEAKD